MRLLLFLCALSVCLLAQSPLGTVTGLAVDPSGAPIPSAAVVLTNEATGIRVETATNSTGNYLFPNLAPGSYKLAAEAKGFRKLEAAGLSLAAFRTLRQDLHFALESSSAEVTVAESASPVIQTESPSVSFGLSKTQILELPSNLRSVYNNSGDSGLIANLMPLTVPGVVQMGSGAYWMVPGGGPNGLKLKVDGIETNFGNFGSPDPVSQPSMEAVEEFTANLTTNRAEFGGLGTVTTVTKSGTNQYHGDLFWYGKNAALDARNPFLTARPFQNIHDFGFSAGGPIRKDKTFAFLTFEEIRGVRSYPFTSSVPTLAQRGGQFSAAVKDPYANNAPFTDNKIPVSRLTPEALKAQALLYPLPNFGDASLTAGNYRAAFNGPEVHHLFETRIDHNFTSSHSAFLRYQWKYDDYDIPGARGQLPPVTEGTSKNLRQMNFISFGDIWTVSPTLFNEFRAGLVALESKSSADVKGQSLLDQIGITGLPVRSGAPGVPNFSVTGLSTYTQSLLNPVVDNHWQLADNITKIAGRHTLKAGAEVVHWMVNKHVTSNAALFGNFSFQNRYTGQPYGDFLLGLPTTVTRLDPYAAQYFRWTDASFYVQDDFKLNARLSLNYGIRYEYNQPASARGDNFYNFDMATGSAVLPTSAARSLISPYYPSTLPIITGDSIGLGRSLRTSDNNNWAPRAGFSYRVDNSGKTVVRGGAGIYYGHYSVGALGSQVAGPFAVSTTSNNAFSNGAPLFTLAQPFAAPGSAGTLNLNGLASDLKNTYSLQYSLTVERELSRDFGLRLSYIGSKGTQLPYMRNINQPRASATAFAQSRRPYPIYNNVVFAENGANNSYQGLQTGITKRMSRGLQFNSTWVWAKELSEVDDTNNAEINTQIEDAYDRRRDRGNVYSIPRHQWMNQALWELPTGKGKLLGGWQINALINFSTGHWLNAQFSGSDPSNTNTVGGRPDAVGAVTYPGTLGAWFDRTTFAVPTGGRFGNAGRNTVEGPGYVVFNAGVTKKVRFERAGEVQIGASFQNLLNHVNYGQPNMTVNNANGGVITSTHVFLPAGSPRQGQLNLRWKF
ncbi:carboxypeptidase-like regulatory domain-containing protein [uncultured Paludibaculum sp.]|uniref:carboxypeptidase-like regulatory domain-containing protein n=1 Tax=uncultured Paludibaculum sp. TaxID=1765020 RepID=UPI002AAB70AA|nr:carboxypeptidase-like regulatory domain-containing protein [uncultured Paludibaculum sp.]